MVLILKWLILSSSASHSTSRLVDWKILKTIGSYRFSILRYKIEDTLSRRVPLETIVTRTSTRKTGLASLDNRSRQIRDSPVKFEKFQFLLRTSRKEFESRSPSRLAKSEGPLITAKILTTHVVIRCTRSDPFPFNYYLLHSFPNFVPRDEQSRRNVNEPSQKTIVSSWKVDDSARIEYKNELLLK